MTSSMRFGPMSTCEGVKKSDDAPLRNHDGETEGPSAADGHRACRGETARWPRTRIDSFRSNEPRGLRAVAERGPPLGGARRRVPVGFAQVKILEAIVAHLDEIDVHPDHGRRGIGTRLVRTVCEWSALNGYQAVTLATFRDVQWNMPFYAQMGFEVIAPQNLSSALRSVIDDEKRRGLDTTRRVVMQRRSV